ncbi:MAG TPA: asparagine synthase (glutamine-hydrolyzing) [Gemmatirosa sp.]|jgi:asparagine synthase (glutamine-hydrolysing)|nr:asparagine synthase (glutamine-hydrolyzing) [Gemmatirosa sp.]
MCGIAGYAGWTRAAERGTSDLRRMCGAIRHRGPDDEGHFVAPGVALGMRRLSIIDVSGGRQPIGNEDGSVQVVFNGEIYNHRTLQRELEGRGHRFATSSDTETLVHLYEEDGDRLVHRLRGMFGFALWDARRHRLLVARDRLGIKPLYYFASDDGVAFASEVRSLRALEGLTLDVDPGAVADYLAFGYVPEPSCIYRGVRKLPPGHLLTWDREHGVRVERYWSPVRETLRIDEDEAVEELRRRFADAVGCHLEAEVPLGAFLSGGVDSSAVVAQMARLMDRPVRTFSIGFAEDAYNEAPHAARVARALGTEHTELIVRPDADTIIERVILGFDEPFADSSALPTFLVSELARRHVTVALSGDGGDELFGGYTRYAETLARPVLPAALHRPLGALARSLPVGMRGRGRLLNLSRSRHGQYTGWVASPLDPREGGVARADLPGGRRPLASLLAPLFDEIGGADDPLRWMTLTDVQTYLPGDILTKVDRMSMAVSLEARVPLLDHEFAEFALALPSALKRRDGTGKWIFRRAVEGLVPPSVLEKPKQGFGVPLEHWMRNELRHRVEAVLRPDSPIGRFVDARAVARLAAEHLRGHRDQSMALWSLLVLDVWLRGAERGDEVPARPPAAILGAREVVPSGTD